MYKFYHPCLQEKGADVKAELPPPKGNALHEAAIYGRDEAVSALIDWGLDPNKPKSDGWAAVHLAVIGGAPLPVLRALAEKGADLNQRTGDGYGKTALDIMKDTIRPQLEIIEYLEQATGAYISERCTWKDRGINHYK